MIYNILNKIPEKNLEWKSTTSKKWKFELLDFFKDKETKNCLEIGTNLGWTSLAISSIFNEVYTVEQKKECIIMENA